VPQWSHKGLESEERHVVPRLVPAGEVHDGDACSLGNRSPGSELPVGHILVDGTPEHIVTVRKMKFRPIVPVRKGVVEDILITEGLAPSAVPFRCTWEFVQAASEIYSVGLKNHHTGVEAISDLRLDRSRSAAAYGAQVWPLEKVVDPPEYGGVRIEVHNLGELCETHHVQLQNRGSPAMVRLS